MDYASVAFDGEMFAGQQQQIKLMHGRLMVGSGMLKAGEWNNEGWRELSAEGVVPIPASLQQIDHCNFEKVLPGLHSHVLLIIARGVEHWRDRHVHDCGLPQRY